MQRLTPLKISNNNNTISNSNQTDDLINQKKSINEQYRLSQSAQFQNPDKVKNMLENFHILHQQTEEDDEDEDNYQFVSSSNKNMISQKKHANETNENNYNKPLSESFQPPSTFSVGNEQRIRTENQQIMASHMQNMEQNQFPIPKQEGFTTDIFQFSRTPMEPNTIAYSSEKTDNLDLGAYRPSIVKKGPFPYTQKPQEHELYLKNMPGVGVGAGIKNAGIGSNIHNDGDLLLKKLNYMIHLMEEQKDEKTKGATEEIVLYSFLGVFIIFLIDSFSRVGKYTR